MACGVKLPDWKIKTMKEMYAAGEDMHVIADQLETSRQTVMRYCLGIQRKTVKKMLNSERNELLTAWRAA
jgi:DNA-binding NarL/FixJ family response regulator